MLTLNVYGIHLQINTNDSELDRFIEQYYEIFLNQDELSHQFDVILDLEKYSYFTRRRTIPRTDDFIRFGDSIWIDRNGEKYYFENNEISACFDFSSETIRIKAIFQPLFIRHWLNILLQGFTRIKKYYNRFIIKTLIHDIVFILLEKKLNINILHATAVTNGEKTFIFTGLGGSGKSTLASTLLTQKGFTILSDNYCLVRGTQVFPFPELPRITSETSDLLGLKKGKKADGIKTYLSNPLNGIENSYTITAVFLASYGKNFLLEQINNTDYIFELLTSINNYTKEFPEYLNLSLLSFLGQYNTNKNRVKNLELFIQDNKFLILQNSSNVMINIDKILDV